MPLTHNQDPDKNYIHININGYVYHFFNTGKKYKCRIEDLENQTTSQPAKLYTLEEITKLLASIISTHKVLYKEFTAIKAEEILNKNLNKIRRNKNK